MYVRMYMCMCMCMCIIYICIYIISHIHACTMTHNPMPTVATRFCELRAHHCSAFGKSALVAEVAPHVQDLLMQGIGFSV